ncbi:MAG: aldo/keto reductase [Candidatus Nanohaloarchaea archaeon]
MEYVHIQNEQVPALGFGTWQLEGKECYRGVMDALEIGYRHIDTAQAYGNEEEVGRAIEESDVSRENIWLTTKIWRDNLDRENLRRSVEESLEKLRTNYVDLLLIHWPFPEIDLEEVIEEMEELVEEGKALHIGVSNFTPEQVEEAQQLSSVPLFTDQVEYHPFLDQGEVLEACREHRMMLTAYSPLARGDVVEDETLEEIGEKYGKTSAQVALRWLVQQEGVAAIPKASSGEHRRQNFDIFDFELDEAEMERINGLSRNDRKVDPSFGPW